jgi:hypothetical protein
MMVMVVMTVTTMFPVPFANVVAAVFSGMVMMMVAA